MGSSGVLEHNFVTRLLSSVNKRTLTPSSLNDFVYFYLSVPQYVNTLDPPTLSTAVNLIP